MQNNEIIVKSICITKEHDKICILEDLLNNDRELEKLVSNFIDYSIKQDEQLKTHYLNQLKSKINNVILFEKIIQLSTSIAEQTPIETTIEINDKTNIIIKHLNKPFIPLFV